MLARVTVVLSLILAFGCGSKSSSNPDAAPVEPDAAPVVHPDAAAPPDAFSPQMGTCTPGATCQVAPSFCVLGTATCDQSGNLASCDSTGTNADKGTACGNGEICDGNGACACVGFGGGAGPISQSVSSIIESETHLARTASGKTAVAWIAIQPSGNSTIGYRILPDGGCGEPGQIQSPNGEVGSDPVLAVDKEDNIYVTWIGFKFDTQGNPYDMHVYVAVAAPGDITFGAPIEVTSNVQTTDAFDKPWITVTGQDTVVITYARTSSGGIFAARSTDHGQNWSTATIVEDGGFRNLVYPCVGGDRLFVTYVASGGIGLRWSDDDGQTWPTGNATAVAAMGEAIAFDDPTCVATSSDVWVSYGLSNDSFTESSTAKLFAIRVAHSTDQGASIASRVNAEDTSVGKYFFHPQLVRESAGAMHVLYYAGNAEGDQNGSFRRSMSVDSGATWGKSVSLLDGIAFVSGRDSPQWLGDYFGAVWDTGILYAAFAANEPTYSHIDVVSVPVN